MYADYDYYRHVYQGELPENRFSRCCTEASFLIDRFTDNAAQAFASDERVKLAACALADTLAKDHVRMGIASEQTDGYSVRYTYPRRSAYFEVAAVYLAELNILSRWV